MLTNYKNSVFDAVFHHPHTLYNKKGIILLIIKIWKRESYYGWSQY